MLLYWCVILCADLNFPSGFRKKIDVYLQNGQKTDDYDNERKVTTKDHMTIQIRGAKNKKRLLITYLFTPSYYW
jgi:hypothetical protein